MPPNAKTAATSPPNDAAQRPRLAPTPPPRHRPTTHALDPALFQQHHHVTTQQRPPTTPISRHVTPRRSTHTAATSLLLPVYQTPPRHRRRVVAGGQGGEDGRRGHDERRRRGKGTTYASSPGILVNDGGEDGTNGASPSHPRRSCSVVDRGQRENYTLSPSTSLTPLIRGGFFLFASALKPPPVLGGFIFPFHVIYPLVWGVIFF
jgi:hypothetical protein